MSLHVGDVAVVRRLASHGPGDGKAWAAGRKSGCKSRGGGEEGEGARAKLRGKLLYKKSQIRKLEKAATAADDVLASKLQELENQRRALLSAAEPRLAALYAEHDGMEEEIQKMTEKK